MGWSGTYDKTLTRKEFIESELQDFENENFIYKIKILKRMKKRLADLYLTLRKQYEL